LSPHTPASTPRWRRSPRTLIESEHIEIAKAIVAGQPQKAQKAMADHIRTMISVHKADLGAQMYDLIDWR
jgi:DNA-binding FadR family transcriptional regulator